MTMMMTTMTDAHAVARVIAAAAAAVVALLVASFGWRQNPRAGVD